MSRRSNDSLVRAWRLRTRIHAWLKQHQESTMRQICAAMPDVEFETVRSAIKRMRRRGYIAMHGTRGCACYTAHGDNAGGPDDERQRMRENGMRRGRLNVAHIPRANGRFAPPAYKTVHRSTGPCLPSHGGQSVSHLPARGHSSLV